MRVYQRILLCLLGLVFLYGCQSPTTVNGTPLTITYDSNGGLGAMASQTATAGSSLTLRTNAFTYAGHTFTGWNTVANGSGTGYSGGGTLRMGSSNLVLYAQWLGNSNTITYKANGGSGTMAPQKAITDSSVTLATNTFTYAGYTFTGWNTFADGSGWEYPAGGRLTMGSSNVVLYAQWSGNTNSIAYKANGGSGSMSSQYAVTGSTVTLTAHTFTYTGYTFSGWNTIADGSGTAYSDGGTLTMGSSDLVLYAQWSGNTYTISYKANGGSGTMASQKATTGSTVNLANNTFTFAGYAFNGWNTAANGSGVSYANSASFTMGATNVTLHAVWTGSGSAGGGIVSPPPPTNYSVTIDGPITVLLGSSGTYTSTYGGSPTAYEWSLNGLTIDGATSQSYTFSPIRWSTPKGANLLSLTITDTNGSSYTGNLVVTVQ